MDEKTKNDIKRQIEYYLSDENLETDEFFGNRQLVTVFSAPNYCGEFDNNGAIMDVDENLMCSFKVIKGEPKS